MYRPSMYNKHDETMNAFAEQFNRIRVYSELLMRPNPEETFDNDGYFVNTKTNTQIGFDWEYRDRYFSNCKLQFDTLGQYERKLRKDSIQIAIQCDSTVTGVAVGWHEDWLQEERERRYLKTDFSKRENGSTRYTHKFRIYSMDEIEEFKRMIEYAMRMKIYSAKAFDYTVNTQAGPVFIERVIPQNSTNGLLSLIQFFQNAGCEVVDKRDRGGCLWVVGDEKKIGTVVNQAKQKYRISGNYGSGRATGYRDGWFTKSDK